MENRDFVLKCLLESRDYISGESLCAGLGITRTAIWKIIEGLRQEGYEIEAKSRVGYRLVSLPDNLERLELELACPGWSFQIFDEVTSTNTLARNLADEGAGDKTVVIARAQTKGRGRFAREFESLQDMGLWISVLLRPKGPPDQAPLYTVLAAVALNNAFEQLLGSRAGIKWVNDLMFNGKKSVGILTEASTEGETGNLRHLVVGIGINLLQKPEDFSKELRQSATSIRQATGRKIRRADMAAALLGRFEEYYHEGRIVNRGRLLDSYKKDLNMLGKNIMVHNRADGTSYAARAVDIDRDASLVVELEDGRRTILSSGEISIRI